MVKYRIVTRLEPSGHAELYQVQWKGLIFWHDHISDDYWKTPTRDYDLKEATRKLHDLVLRDEREAERKSRHKDFKSKVVYGPYP